MRESLSTLLKDFVVLNAVIGVIAIFLALFGLDLLNVFLIILLLFSAFLLLIGGATGFLLSAVSYESLRRILGGITKRITRAGNGGVEAEKTKEEREKEVKKSMMTGKRLVILGGLLLLESLLISLILIA